MTSISASYIKLIPTEPVGSRQPERGSNSRLDGKSMALPLQFQKELERFCCISWIMPFSLCLRWYITAPQTNNIEIGSLGFKSRLKHIA